MFEIKSGLTTKTTADFASRKDLAAVPGEVRGVRSESGLGCERKRTSVEVGEFEVTATGKYGLGDFGLGHADAEVVIDGPEAGVEESIGSLIMGLGMINGV